MVLAPGAKLGPYEITAPLGSGGMGEVYRATDTRLARAVAIKVLSTLLGDDPAGRLRFDREARAIAGLNHPNICTLLDVGEHGGRSFLVMELVDGETLAERLEKGPIPLDVALRYAIEIAAALELAHRHAMVHRDLKPGNVMITRAGTKLLDFGLAKFLPAPAGAELATQAAAATSEGLILGTLQYMSPEQLEGLDVDARTDIFAFGALLYEMITGRRAFEGKSQATIIGAILRDHPPPISSVQPLAPVMLDRLVATCLQKDPADRWQSAADLGRELRWLAEDLKPRSGVGLPAASDGHSARQIDRLSGSVEAGTRWRRVSTTVALMLLALVAGWLLRGRAPDPPPPWKLARLTSEGGLSDFPAISPDGKFVAYSWDGNAGRGLDLYVKQTVGGQPIRLTTDGTDNTMPDFSPDGSKIVFRSSRNGGGIYEVSALGGGLRLIAGDGLNPKYSPEGSRVAYWTGGGGVAAAVPGSGSVWVVGVAGGSPERVGATFTTAQSPVWSPDGKHLLVLGYTSKQAYEVEHIDWWLVALDGSESIRTGAFAVLERGGVAVALVNATTGTAFPQPLCWSAARRSVLFTAAIGDTSDLWEAAIAPRTGLVTGPVERVTTSSGHTRHANCSAGIVTFTDAETRRDVWSIPAESTPGDPAVRLERITDGPATRDSLSLSHDKKHVAFSSDQSGDQNIWIRDLASGTEAVVARSALQQRYPVIDRAGARIAYSVFEPGKRVVYVSAPGGVPEKLCEGCLRVTDWSPDGKSVLIFGGNPYEISRLDVVSHRQTVIVKHPSSHLLYGRLSPDGHWISFTVRTAPDRAYIAVAPIDDSGRPVAETAWLRIAESGPGDWAEWSADGNTLYFPSDRDGSVCFWGQRLDVTKRRLAGDPFSVQHLHGLLTYRHDGWSAAGNRIAFVLVEEKGSIWMMSRSKTQ